MCGYGGSAVCPHCQDLVTTMDEVRSGGHKWEQDTMNHPLFGHEQVSIVGNKSTFCRLYRESGNSLLAFHWKVPGQDPCTLNQAEVDELVEFMDADQLERWRESLLIPKKKTPSQKARKIKPRFAKPNFVKAKRAAAMHENK